MLILPKQAAPMRMHGNGISLRQQLEAVHLYLDILESNDRADEARFDVISLFQDATKRERKEIVETLASNSYLEIILLDQLMEIDIESSLPILIQSPAFADEELMDLIHCSDDRVGAAIVEREYLSPKVIDYIVKCAEGLTAVATLRKFHGRLPFSIKEDLAFRAANTDKGRTAVLTLFCIEDDIKCSIIEDWANRLADYAGETGLIERHATPNWSRQAVERALLVAAHEFENVANENLITEFSKRSWISPSFLIRALLSGHKALFVTILSKLTRVSSIEILNLFDTYDGQAFAEIYAKSGLPQASIKVFAGLLRHFEETIDECSNLQWDSFSERLAGKTINLFEERFPQECETEIEILTRISRETVQDFRVSVMSEYLMAA